MNARQETALAAIAAHPRAQIIIAEIERYEAAAMEAGDRAS